MFWACLNFTSTLFLSLSFFLSLSQPFSHCGNKRIRGFNAYRLCWFRFAYFLVESKINWMKNPSVYMFVCLLVCLRFQKKKISGKLGAGRENDLALSMVDSSEYYSGGGCYFFFQRMSSSALVSNKSLSFGLTWQFCSRFFFWIKFVSGRVSVINPLTVLGLWGNFWIMSRARPVNGTKCRLLSIMGKWCVKPRFSIPSRSLLFAMRLQPNVLQQSVVTRWCFFFFNAVAFVGWKRAYF